MSGSRLFVVIGRRNGLYWLLLIEMMMIAVKCNGESTRFYPEPSSVRSRKSNKKKNEFEMDEIDEFLSSVENNNIERSSSRKGRKKISFEEFDVLNKDVLDNMFSSDAGGGESDSEDYQIPLDRSQDTEESMERLERLSREMGGGDSDDNEENWEEEFGKGSEKGSLYEAYNMLHSLAQDFDKPFDAPAVLVVGHQSSGKSALIEALMGFQFNSVGGGTKTRRPIALRMQYNPQCSMPRCYLRDDNDGIEREHSLSEVQDYIQRENERLEIDPVRCFDAREINIRMEYKYCPNMILIDTPGLISATVSKRKNSPSLPNASQKALAASAREVERLVISKMNCPDYIILCVEDTCDWKHGVTRSVVQKADPELSRTVIVNTKLDTKIPQFGSNDDIFSFLKADIVDRISPHKMAGPYFTSVPAGRVGLTDDHFFTNDDEFVAAIADVEDTDRMVLRKRLHKLSSSSNLDTNELLSRVGIARLRQFLEEKVDECYRKNVNKIIPLLRADHEAAKMRLEAVDRELERLSVQNLKRSADVFCDEFCDALKESLQGNIIAPVDEFGETLEQEVSTAGGFHDVTGAPLSVTPSTWGRLLPHEVGNTNNRLYGGSQYHRALREFNLATRCLRLPIISQDEIANAVGIGDRHDGVNFLRAACVISLEKARVTFDPLLDALRIRLIHVMKKLWNVSEYMLNVKNEREMDAMLMYSHDQDNSEMIKTRMASSSTSSDISQNPHFRNLIHSIFDKFVQQCSDSATMRCRDDITALTRFVTWDLNERGVAAIQQSLPDETDAVTIYQVAVKAVDSSENDATTTAKNKKQPRRKQNKNKEPNDKLIPSTEMPVTIPTALSNDNGVHNLAHFVEETILSSRDSNRTTLVVGSLVQHIVCQWRQAFCKSITTKFNCFYLMPFVNEFHRFLRMELEKIYEGLQSGESPKSRDIADVFDITAARASLQKKRQELSQECTANEKLQEKFRKLANMMEMNVQSHKRDVNENIWRDRGTPSRARGST